MDKAQEAMADPSHPDAQRKLRNALGAYATGVTVITALGEGERAVGITVSSFNSVSLSPPLVLWSLSRRSPNLESFAPGRGHVIHVLSSEQQELALRFSRPQPDKFAGLDCARSLRGLPLIAGCSAVFECVTEARHEGGDHLIMVSRVESYTAFERDPLLFCRGKFFGLAEMSNSLA